MIKISGVTKSFGNICAVNDVSLTVPEGVMFGLLGTNGAGKSTLLRIMVGILEPDAGRIFIDSEEDNTDLKCKENLFYLPDSPYFFPNAGIEDMARFYKKQYPQMDIEAVHYMSDTLSLDKLSPLRTFSKGMKRQAFLLLALSSNTKYLICDEVFDGLDPIVTEIMKNLIRQEMKKRDFTVIVASHRLRELQDICHNIAIIHRGGILTADEFKGKTADIHKIQCVFDNLDPNHLKNMPNVVHYQSDGYFTTLIVRGDIEEIMKRIVLINAIFFKEIPLTLEETFMAVMEETGYDISKIL